MNEYNEKPKRTVNSIIKSLEFDKDKKLLIVEGKADRLFFEFVCNNINDNCIILEVENVEMESVEGGNKGKILAFAKSIPYNSENIKFFVDRDYDLDEANSPFNTFITDFKDLESYLLNKESLNKFLKIGLKTDKITSDKLLNDLKSSNYFGHVRNYSLTQNKGFSVNDCNENLTKYVSYTKNYIEIDCKKYLTVLCQISAVKIKIDDLILEIENFIKKQNKDFRFVIHGKDIIKVLVIICLKLGFKKDSIESAFWMSFDEKKVSNYPNLLSVINYLK